MIKETPSKDNIEKFCKGIWEEKMFVICLQAG